MIQAPQSKKKPAVSRLLPMAPLWPGTGLIWKLDQQPAVSDAESEAHAAAVAAAAAAGATGAHAPDAVHVESSDCVMRKERIQPPELPSAGAYAAVPDVADTGTNVPAQPTAQESAVKTRPAKGRTRSGRHRRKGRRGGGGGGGGAADLLLGAGDGDGDEL